MAIYSLSNKQMSALLLIIILLAGQPMSVEAVWKRVIVGSVAGVTAAVVGVPVVLHAVGFGAGGIVAGTFAAKAMSIASTTSVGASIVGAAQSVAAAGMGSGGAAAGAAVGASLARVVAKLKGK